MMRRALSLFLLILFSFCAPTWATVTEQVARVQYTAAGSSSYLFSWPIWDASEIVVYVDDTEQATSAYSVTFTAGDSSGGTVTFTTAPTSGSTVTIVRRSEQARTTDFSTSGPFSMSALNSQVDRLTTQVQDLQEQVNRSLRYKVSNTESFPYSVPGAEWPSPQAAKVLGYGSSGLPLLYTPTSASVMEVLNSVSQVFTATSGQTVFNLNFSYAPDEGELAVYLNGVRQQPEVFSETDSTTLTFSEGLDAGDQVFIIRNEWTGPGTRVDTIYTLGLNDATPSVQIGRLFTTSNTSPTTITAFDGGVVGQEIVILVGDANTTFDFTASSLKGNAGVDFSAADGDVIRATYDGTNWLCEVSDNT